MQNETDQQIDVSVVVPVYRGQATVRLLAERVANALAPTDYRGELIFVDDASPDRAWEELTSLSSSPRLIIRGCRHARNMGQHQALLTGMQLATGRVVITMDDDLQHPPEAIPAMMDALASGFDLAIASYDEKKHSRWRNMSGGVVDQVLRRLYGLEPDFQLTSFRAFTRPICDAATKLSTAFPYVTAMLLSQSSRCTNVLVPHAERHSGVSNYSTLKSLKLAANLIFNYSSFPIYLLLAVASTQLLFGLIGSLAILLLSVFGKGFAAGWASMMLVVIVCNSVNMFSIILVALYVKRIYQQVTHAAGRPAIAAMHG